jgi:hypothetical protein
VKSSCFADFFFKDCGRRPAIGCECVLGDVPWIVHAIAKWPDSGFLRKTPEEGIRTARMMGEMGFDSLEVSGGVYADGFSC